jgi:hypothetical protein
VEEAEIDQILEKKLLHQMVFTLTRDFSQEKIPVNGGWISILQAALIYDTKRF